MGGGLGVVQLELDLWFGESTLPVVVYTYIYTSLAPRSR
jgi:hypothetical protein